MENYNTQTKDLQMMVDRSKFETSPCFQFIEAFDEVGYEKVDDDMKGRGSTSSPCWWKRLSGR